jgi:hypothetical protein
MNQLENIVKRLVTKSRLGEFVRDDAIDGVCTFLETRLDENVLEFLLEGTPTAEQVYSARSMMASVNKRMGKASSKSSFRTGKLAYFLLEEHMLRANRRREKKLIVLYDQNGFDFSRDFMRAYGFTGEAAWYLAENIPESIQNADFREEMLERSKNCLESSEKKGNKHNKNYQTSAMVIYELLKSKIKYSGEVDVSLVSKFLQKSKGYVRTFQQRPTGRYSNKHEIDLHSFEHLFVDFSKLLINQDLKLNGYGQKLKNFYETQVRGLHEHVHGNTRDFKTNVVF